MTCFAGAPPRCPVVETWQFTAPWGFRGATTSAAFYYVLQCGCRLEATGINAAVSLAVGDLAVLMPGREYCLRDSRNSPAVPLRELLGTNATQMRRGVMPDEEGRTTRLIYGSVVFDERQIVRLLDSVPPVVVIPGANGTAMPWLDRTLRLMIHECDEGQVGSQAIVDCLAQVIFIQALRKCFSACLADAAIGWLH